MQLGEAFSSSYVIYKRLNVKGEFISIKRAWTRKKSAPRQELNQWPPEPRVGALFTELREFMELRAITCEEIHAGGQTSAHCSTNVRSAV